MITLLLTFFILFFSLDKVDPDSVANSVKKDIVAILAPEAPSNPVAPPPPDAMHPDAMAIGTDPYSRGVEKKVIADFGGELTKKGHQITIRFPGISFFNSGSIRLTRAGADHLRKFAQAASKYPNKYTILVRAFTDSTQVRKIPGRAFQDNLELSGLRSIAAMRELTQAGLPLTSMRIAGFGEVSDPESGRNPAQVRVAEDRKIVITLEPEWRERSGRRKGEG
jgi:flagellar motor protein MotB